MAKSDFVPARDGDFASWLANLSAQATALAQTTTVIAGSDQALIAQVLTEYNTAATAASSASAMAQQATAARKTARRNVEDNVRPLVRKWKANGAYTVSMGEQLGVEGPEDTIDMAAAKPKLTGKAQPHGVVELQFNKSKSDGVNIYCQRDGDGGFVFLARDTASPYVDNRTLSVAGKPEVRKYKAIYVIEDTEVGQPSDEVAVTCQP